MISLAHSLGLQVVAEGVETEEQVKILRLLKGDEIQGYAVSRPISEDEFGQWWQAYDATGRSAKGQR